MHYQFTVHHVPSVNSMHSIFNNNENVKPEDICYLVHFLSVAFFKNDYFNICGSAIHISALKYIIAHKKLLVAQKVHEHKLSRVETKVTFGMIHHQGNNTRISPHNYTCLCKQAHNSIS